MRKRRLRYARFEKQHEVIVMGESKTVRQGEANAEQKIYRDFENSFNKHFEKMTGVKNALGKFDASLPQDFKTLIGDPWLGQPKFSFRFYGVKPEDIGTVYSALKSSLNELWWNTNRIKIGDKMQHFFLDEKHTVGAVSSNVLSESKLGKEDVAYFNFSKPLSLEIYVGVGAAATGKNLTLEMVPKKK